MLYGLLNLLRAMSQKQRKRGILQRRLQSLLGFRDYVLSLFSILRARRDRWQPRLDPFRYLKFILDSQALGNKTKEIIAEPQDDFSSFIPPSLGTKYEFQYIEIGLFLLISVNGTLSLNAVFHEVLA